MSLINLGDYGFDYRINLESGAIVRVGWHESSGKIFVQFGENDNCFVYSDGRFNEKKLAEMAAAVCGFINVNNDEDRLGVGT